MPQQLFVPRKPARESVENNPLNTVTELPRLRINFNLIQQRGLSPIPKRSCSGDDIHRWSTYSFVLQQILCIGSLLVLPYSDTVAYGLPRSTEAVDLMLLSLNRVYIK